MKVIRFLLIVLLVPFGSDLGFSYEKPRRVFTRGFVGLCMMVATLEWLILHDIYNK